MLGGMERVIRPLQLPDDYDAFMDLYHDGYGEDAHAGLDMLTWALQDNPDNPAPSLMYTMREGDAMIASDGMTVQRLSLGGRHVLIGNDLMSITHSAFQRQGIFRTMTENSIAQAREHGVDIILGLANENSFPAYKKFGFQILWQKDILLKPVMISGALERRVKNAGVAKVGQKLWRLLDDKLLMRSALAGYDVECVDTVPEAAGQLWERIEPLFDIAHVRDFAYLDYRYNQRPDDHYQTVLLSRRGALVGVAIFREISGGHSRGLVVTELFCDPDNVGDIRALGAALTQCALERGCAYISTSVGGYGAFEKVLTRMGYRRTANAERTMIARVINEDIDPALLEGYHRWHYSQGDGETDFY